MLSRLLLAAQSDSLDLASTGEQTSNPLLNARFNGPNSVIVDGEASSAGEQLVVLTSYYPGWQLLVDGQRAPLVPINDYLGANLQPGNHTYEFVFRPAKYYIGAAISLVTVATIIILILSETAWFSQRSAGNQRVWTGLQESAADKATALRRKLT